MKNDELDAKNRFDNRVKIAEDRETERNRAGTRRNEAREKEDICKWSFSLSSLSSECKLLLRDARGKNARNRSTCATRVLFGRQSGPSNAERNYCERYKLFVYPLGSIETLVEGGYDHCELVDGEC